MAQVQNGFPVVGIALFSVQKQTKSSEIRNLKKQLKSFDAKVPSESFRINKDHLDSQNFAGLIQDSPFQKYPVKIISTLDIPHRYVQLTSLEIYSSEPDRSVSPGISSDRSNETYPSTGDLDIPLKSILKKPNKSRFVYPGLKCELKPKKSLQFVQAKFLDL